MNQVISFEDSVKLRLKTIVAELIPEDRWDGLVRAAVLDFEKNDLPKLVKAELAAKYKEAIAAEFQKPEWRAQWQGTETGASEAVKKLIIEMAPVVLSGMIGGAIQQTVQSLQYNIQNRTY